MEITINARQMLALVWTFIAIVLSLIVVLAMGWYYSSVPWWTMIAAFFGVLLVITLPAYLLIALWGITSKSETD
jgi:hypothetical protein